jgi:hypothetical protein
MSQISRLDQHSEEFRNAFVREGWTHQVDGPITRFTKSLDSTTIEKIKSFVRNGTKHGVSERLKSLTASSAPPGDT